MSTLDKPDKPESKKKSGKLPGTFKKFVERFPELADTHETIAKVVDEIGPLDAKTCHLIKLGMSMGAGLESAVRSHVRRATQNGATVVEVEQAIMLGMNTLGFPRTVASWAWAHQQFDRDRKEEQGK